MVMYSFKGYLENMYVRVTALAILAVFIMMYKSFPDPMSIAVAALIVTTSAYLLGAFVERPTIITVGILASMSYWVYSFIFYFFKLTEEQLVLQQEFLYGLVFGGLTGAIYWVLRRR